MGHSLDPAAAAAAAAAAEGSAVEPHQQVFAGRPPGYSETHLLLGDVRGYPVPCHWGQAAQMDIERNAVSAAVGGHCWARG